MKAHELRESFLAYFEGHGHRRVRSSALIPAKDPTLLFTNAGMVQFKDVFLGTDPRDYKRATTAQKCVRAGGKHNDLENVGRTARHHTFFEMMGNFSFGDYFKKDAIAFAWEYLTKTLGLPREKLWVSVFRDDDEAADLWVKGVGFPRERLVRLGEKDNFWAMGDTGPCGPCSEIIIDQGPEVGCGQPDCGPECDCDRYLEIWNLVFMQYERDASGKLEPLPRPSIDTGLGLERVAAVVQGFKNNFDTDLFVPIIRFEEGFTKHRLGQGEKSDVSFRVIADHLRSAVFLVSDGVIPSNEGRGYVLRRIMRRAGRHAYMLGIHQPILHRGVGLMAELMGEAYPELRENAAYAEGMIRQEEERFHATLEAGLGLLSEVMEDLRKKKQGTVPGGTLFKLYDTYGFPLDLAEEITRDEGLSLDTAGFERLMEEQKTRARASWAGSGEEGMEGSWRAVMERIAPTVFTGYEQTTGTATVLGLVSGGAEAASAEKGAQVDLFLDSTPFYGTSGGQVGDTGELVGDSCRVSLTGIRKAAEKYTVHQGVVAEGTLRVGARLEATVDVARRAAISRNHTATHLLQAALRRIVGDHVKQAGSQVMPDKLRFDFTHFRALSHEELRRVEDLVNAVILDNESVSKEEMAIDAAVKSGAMAIFGEKYGETVRVVRVPGFSAELCGGIHVRRAGDIGLFKITSESASAAGVRRIEAVTGTGALALVRQEEETVRELSALLKTGRDGLTARVRGLQDEIRELDRQLEKSRSASAAGHLDEIVTGALVVGGVKMAVARLDGLDMEALRGMTDRLKEKLGDAAIVLVSVHEGKLLLTAGASGQAQARVHAGKLVGQLAALAGGKGGGRPDFAQAGAKETAVVGTVVAEAKKHLASLLG